MSWLIDQHPAHEGVRDFGDVKQHRAQVGEVFDGQRTGIEVGDWRGRPVDAVELVGMARDLHGTVCRCCPRRDERSAA